MSEPIRVAVPLSNGQVSDHFGRSDAFLIYEIDNDAATITRRKEVSMRAVTCESIPVRLASFDVRVVLARLAGVGARVSLAAKGIELLSGWEATDPDALLASYAAGQRPTAEGRCTHSDHEDHHRQCHRGEHHK